jgi:hypothetical protein
MRTAARIAATLSGLAIALASQPVSANEVADENERIMEEAAASLTPFLPENRAYMLARRSDPDVPFWSEVAVVFGYTNNKEACTLIAEAMQNSSRERSSVRYDCKRVDPE